MNFQIFLRKAVPFHFEIEERSLFPMLERAAGFEKTLILDLVAEHKIIIKMISEFLAIVKSGIENEDRKRELVKIGGWIIEKLSAHAQREDAELLPLAHKVLDQEKLEELEKIVKNMIKTSQ
ncbi:MAG: hemerythrin domain-containing protein [Candidatus Bathyarchaeia archaeon]